jgi:hypothetical protein
MRLITTKKTCFPEYFQLFAGNDLHAAQAISSGRECGLPKMAAVEKSCYKLERIRSFPNFVFSLLSESLLPCRVPSALES